MMFPFGDRVVTLFHAIENLDVNGRTVVTWQKNVYKNCFVGKTENITLQTDGTLTTNYVIVKIPQAIEVSLDDILVVGEFIGDVKQAKKIGYVVKDITDNFTNRRLGHFKIIGV